MEAGPDETGKAFLAAAFVSLWAPRCSNSKMPAYSEEPEHSG